MAFVVTGRQTGNNGITSAGSLTTSSATPTANSLFLVLYGAQIDNGAAELPVLLAATGGSLSYTLVDKHGDGAAIEWGSGSGGFCIGARVDRAAIGGSPSAFAATVDAANAPSNAFHCAICLDITGHNAASPIVQVAHNGARINPESGSASGTVTFTNPVTAGNLIGVFYTAGDDGGGGFASPTAGAGKTFQTVVNQTQAACDGGAFYREADGAESQTITCSDLGTTVGNYVAIAFEIASGTTPPPADAGLWVPQQSIILLPQSPLYFPFTTPWAGPDAVVGSDATVTPASVAAVASIPSVTVAAGALVTAVAVIATALIPGASVTTGSGASVSPATTAVVAHVPGPTVQAGVKVTPAAVHGAAAIPAPALAWRYLTAASGNGRYFVDQNSSPVLLRGDSPWSMFTKLSSSEVDTYVANRVSYGVNTMLVSMIGATANGGPNDNGATYDGILPFTGGDPTVFNSTYWARMDSYIAKARDAGITLMIYPIDGWTTLTGCVFDPASVNTTQAQTYGNTLATRYLSYPNLIWAFGGDYFETTTLNNLMGACLTGIRAAGDTRLVTVQLGYETSESDNSTYWEPKVDWDFVYMYRVTYKGMKDGYDHTWSVSPTTKPALFGEGAYEGSTDPNHPGTDLVIRRQAAWALTSGSPGEFTGQEGVWDFQSGWSSLLSTTAAGQLKAIRDAIQGVAWWTLIPDDASQLVTAGRGTRVTTDAATYPTGNTFVTAARAADGTLAVIYLPNASGAITVDMTKIGASPTATWVDPTSGATFSATPGSSYSRGNNAAGSTDWLLILTGLAGTTVTPASVAAVASVPAPAVQAGETISSASVAGAASVPSPAVGGSASVTPATVAGIGSVSAPTVSAGSTVTAASVNVAAAVPAPAVSAGGNATVAPSSVTATAGVPAPSLNTGSRPSPSTVAAIVSIPSPAVTGGSGATVTPSSVHATATIPAVVILIGVTPLSVATVATVPSPTLSTSALITAASVAAIGRVPAATAYTVAPYTPIIDPVSSVRPNLAKASIRTNPAEA